MATPKFYGGSLPIGSVGPRQVVANPASKAAAAPIPPDRFCRNGKHPNALLVNALGEAGNQAILYRSKELFRGVGAFPQTATPFGVGDRARWRGACHSGPYTHAFFVSAILNTPYGSPGYDYNSYVRLDIYSDVAETTLVKSETIVYGVSPIGSGTHVAFLDELKKVEKIVDGLSPDTDYYLKFTDVDYGRVVSATVFDLQSATENLTGYLPQNVTANSGVLDIYRQNLATVSYNLWRRGGATVLGWTVDDQTAPITTTSGTATNIVDTTSTGAPTSATPGFTLDMRGKARVSQTSGVPCVLKAYGKVAAGTQGNVYLKDSSNNTVASITAAFTTTAGWHSSGVFNLPATVDKYDLLFSSGGGTTTSLYAVTIFEYET